MIAPILKGKKSVLKPIEPKHAMIKYKWYLNQKVAKYQDFSKTTIEAEKKLIIKTRKSKNYLGWIIFTKNYDLIGEIQLRNIDLKNKSAVYSTNIGETTFWGQGYATDALKTVSKYFFNKLKLNRIELRVFPKNLGAIKCYGRCGFKKEGILRKASFKNNKFNDLILMSLIKDDYIKLK